MQYLAAEAQGEQNKRLGVSHQIKPYHYGSHYSNSGIVLHFLVRLPPFTNMFLTFQGDSFDIADRTFRNVSTTWWLSSSESATGVKELIPEFYFFPEFLENTESMCLLISCSQIKGVNGEEWKEKCLQTYDHVVQ